MEIQWALKSITTLRCRSFQEAEWGEIHRICFFHVDINLATNQINYYSRLETTNVKIRLSTLLQKNSEKFDALQMVWVELQKWIYTQEISPCLLKRRCFSRAPLLGVSVMHPLVVCLLPCGHVSLFHFSLRCFPHGAFDTVLRSRGDLRGEEGGNWHKLRGVICVSREGALPGRSVLFHSQEGKKQNGPHRFEDIQAQCPVSCRRAQKLGGKWNTDWWVLMRE